MTRDQEIIRAARPLFDRILGDILLDEPFDIGDLDDLIGMLIDLRSGSDEEHDTR